MQPLHFLASLPMLAALMPKHSIHKHYIKSAHKNWFDFPLICFSCNTLPSSPNSNTCLYTHTHTHTQTHTRTHARTHRGRTDDRLKAILRDLRLSQFCCWRCKPSGIWRSVNGWAVPDVLNINGTFSFRISLRRRLLGLHHVPENLNLQSLSLSLCQVVLRV